MTTDPIAQRGRWLVATASGARHLIDSSDPSAPVTVTRVTRQVVERDTGYELASLRLDGTAIHVSHIIHTSGTGTQPGIAIGVEMLLTLEPLAPWATVTLRRTTPVVSIQRLDRETAIDDRRVIKGQIGSVPHAKER